MLTRVDVLGENPIQLKIRDARPTDSIIVEKIEGLNPPDVDIFMGDYARDGGSYGGRRVPPRTVIFTLSISPNYRNGESVSGLRRSLYKSFMDPSSHSDEIHFTLTDDTVAEREFYGFAEKFETDIFSDDTTAVITVRCPNPYLTDSEVTTINLNGPSGPFTYTGSAEAGLFIRSTIVIPTSVLVFNLNGRTMVLNYAFAAGDQVFVNTSRGSRSIELIRGGVTTNILYSRLPGSIWLQATQETNEISVYGSTPESSVADIQQVRYIGQHWGI